MQNGPRFTVVVLTINSIGTIEPLIEALKTQNFPYPVEYLFMDSCSTDGTVAYLKGQPFPDKKVINVPKGTFSHSGTRQRAAELATGDIVCFFTHDMVPIGPDFLMNLTKPVREGLARAAYGVFQINPDRHDPVDAFMHNGWHQGIPDITGPITPFCWNQSIPALRRRWSNFDDCSSCIRREVLLQYGFPPVSYGEDMLLAKKLLLAGEVTALSREAKFYHWHHVSFSYMMKRMIIDQYLSAREFDIYYVRRKLGVLKAVILRAGQRTLLAFFKVKMPFWKKFYWSFYNLKVLSADFIGKYIGQLPPSAANGRSRINRRLWAYQQKIVAEIDEKSIGRY
jgi:rhamnosyltransferase